MKYGSILGLLASKVLLLFELVPPPEMLPLTPSESGTKPRWPLTSVGSSIKMKGANTMLSKKHCRAEV